MPKQQIKTATPAEIDQCVSLIVLAFANDPAARWLHPDPHAFLEHFPRFVLTFGGRAFEHGSAYLINGCRSRKFASPDYVEDFVPDSHPPAL